MANRIILTINCGSSSIKYLLFDWERRRAAASGMVERIGLTGSMIKHHASGKDAVTSVVECPDHFSGITLIMKTLVEGPGRVLKNVEEISAVGHRVVHGGEKFVKSVKIDGPNGEVLNTLKEIAPLAPLHNPVNIMGIEAALKALPAVPHIAVLDTAFLQTIPRVNFLYPVPYSWYTKYGVRRYGFHGTSHLYVSKRAAVMLKKDPFQVNLVTCHIGNGVSFTAIRNGLAYDHSMGFTPLEGLMMGTRSGDIDPAIIPFICNKEHITSKKVEQILNRESGLKGVSGRFSDRRDLKKAADEGDERAQLALDMEAYRIRKYIGAYMASLGRVDAVVFTAGAGERAYFLREKALLGLEQLGIRLDIEKNRDAVSGNKEFDITTDDSAVRVLVIPTDEELVFVEDVVAILEDRYDIHTSFRYSFQDEHYVNLERQEMWEKERQNVKR
jgi:acetate kinase